MRPAALSRYFFSIHDGVVLGLRQRLTSHVWKKKRTRMSCEEEEKVQPPQLTLLRSLSEEDLFNQWLRTDHIQCVNVEHPKFQTMAYRAVEQAGYHYQQTSKVHIEQAYIQSAACISIEYYVIFCLHDEWTGKQQRLLGRCLVNVVSLCDASGCPQIKETELMEMI